MRKLDLLQPLADKAASCTECELSKNRIKSVFHSGDPETGIIFVGEAGGRDENVQGSPFVGRSGKLLNKMIESMGFERSQVYVTNICKCAPPDNRKPLPVEMKACSPYLLGQLDIIKPKVIVALGATAVTGLCGEGLGITKRRGKWEEYNGIPVMPTYHPAYLLRNPPAKIDAAADLKQVLVKLGKS